MRNTIKVDDVFTRLTVIEPNVAKNNQGRFKSLCLCSCGTQKVVNNESLKNGNTKSCGCLSKELSSARATHGMRQTVEYKTWCNIKERCYNINNTHYKYYGKRGIRMSEERINSSETFA